MREQILSIIEKNSRIDLHELAIILGMEETDIRPMLKSCEIVAGKQELRLNCVVCAQNPALNPMLLVSAIERYAPEAAPDFTKCRRAEVLDADGNVFR